MRCLYCLVLVITILPNAIAQVTESLPVQIGQFFNAYSIVNPASCGTTANVELESGKQGHGGIWKNISTTYVSGSFRIKPKKGNKFHVLGANFVRDKEGEYLRRSKLYVTYGWHTKLTKRLSIGAGFSAGLYSYLVSGTNASIAGGDNAPDVSIGLWLYHQRYYIGASMNQILNSDLTPIQETTRLLRHYNVTGGYVHKVSKIFSLHPKTMIRYAPGYPVDLDIACMGVLDEIVSGGVSYRYNKGIVCMAGLGKLKVSKGRFRCMFSYGFPMGKVASSIQTYEITLRYDHNPDQKKKGK